MVVDWRLCRLAHRSGLNCILDGGRVPPQGLGAEPQDVAGVYVPRPVRGVGPVVGHESHWCLGDLHVFQPPPALRTRLAPDYGPAPNRQGRRELGVVSQAGDSKTYFFRVQEVQDENRTGGGRRCVASVRPDMNCDYRGRGLLPE